MKSIVVLVLIIGIASIVYGYTKSFQKCPKKEIEYRYIPRNIYNEQLGETNLGELFYDMFNKTITKI